MVFEGEVIPDVREFFILDIATDDIEARGDIAVREDVRIQPGAGGRAAVDEGIRFVVIQSDFVVGDVRVEDDGHFGGHFFDSVDNFNYALDVHGLWLHTTHILVGDRVPFAPL